MKQAQKQDKIWERVAQYRQLDKEGIIQSLANHLEFSLCKNRYTYKDYDIYDSLALSIRDRLLEYWNDTQQTYHQKNAKRVYYLSLEFLMGRSLRNNLINLGIYDICKEALAEVGYDLEELEEMEVDAGLGNGGLGRLAACFLDSMASLQLPAYGYGIRYEYGIFKQQILDGEQCESPDNWLTDGCPWEIPQLDYVFPVKFYGHVEQHQNTDGTIRYKWVGGEEVLAVAYDTPVPGYKNHTVNNLRLWSSRSSNEFDFQLFNAGDYLQAVEEKQKSQAISKVLYPNDQGFSGKELRLKQQYFFVSASLQDILRRYLTDHENFDQLPDKVAIQLNDTHPSIAIPELMRILMDDYDITWEKSWEITRKVFAYTNHTVLPEALERWSVDLIGNLLPRHLQIIFEINQQFLDYVSRKHPNDADLLSRVSIIEEGDHKQVRMPYLAIVGSHAVNGVAALHTELLKVTVFQDFYKLFPKRFQNKTNGITPRRWLRNANPELAELITEKIGEEWVTQLDQLKKLIPFAKDAKFQASWRQVKMNRKKQLAKWVQDHNKIDINLDSLFDVQVKRIHEYKRQLLNVLYIIWMYNQIRNGSQEKFVPRTFMLGGKAAPGYHMAKLIIHLINDVAHVVNNDPDIGGIIKVVFLENFGVSLGEKVYPAAELSEQISTAGMEASGTGNMKFALNGALTIGTLDGANIEIKEEVGDENIFIFGMDAEEVMQKKSEGYKSRDHYDNNPELRDVLDMINDGYFNKGNPYLYQDIYNNLVYGDYFMLLADFDSYVECQRRVNEVYLDQKKWTQMSILNTANMGKFSSDRTIREYAKDIWDIEPVKVTPSRSKKR
ncbi:MAG: glycogen/starch/alpha-glucan phosphorylase [SAR324 cluster bacterium]|nr:glycogen/starch/alpha-glucan phosphorylase [SAR324 cluster bacterium]